MDHPMPSATPGKTLRALLGGLADRLDTIRPTAAVTERLVLAQALVIAEQLHGSTEAAEDAERDLLTLLPAVTGQTRGQYAKELRDAARGVAQ
ncbi:hypothetical protein ACFUIZ_06740 [Streptomyces cinereoruber]|uniref:hypothetical protein n=1 Tax=Streptomyces cinereoruber TaxID=67260 RepID=UPI00363C78DA